jgi:hypothetical protein
MIDLHFKNCKYSVNESPYLEVFTFLQNWSKFLRNTAYYAISSLRTRLPRLTISLFVPFFEVHCLRHFLKIYCWGLIHFMNYQCKLSQMNIESASKASECILFDDVELCNTPRANFRQINMLLIVRSYGSVISGTHDNELC